MHNKSTDKIALGGGCHWCTEAIFQSLKGVSQVTQGYISAQPPDTSFSEAVIVHYQKDIIPLEVLIEIHLLTHQSKSNHSMRDLYRSAIYVYGKKQFASAQSIMVRLQKQSIEEYCTKVLYYKDFKPSREQIRNYYRKGPDRPFCVKYIAPKLALLKNKYGKQLKD